MSDDADRIWLDTLAGRASAEADREAEGLRRQLLARAKGDAADAPARDPAREDALLARARSAGLLPAASRPAFWTLWRPGPVLALAGLAGFALLAGLLLRARAAARHRALGTGRDRAADRCRPGHDRRAHRPRPARRRGRGHPLRAARPARNRRRLAPTAPFRRTFRAPAPQLPRARGRGVAAGDRTRPDHEPSTGDPRLAPRGLRGAAALPRAVDLPPTCLPTPSSRGRKHPASGAAARVEALAETDPTAVVRLRAPPSPGWPASTARTPSSWRGGWARSPPRLSPTWTSTPRPCRSSPRRAPSTCAGWAPRPSRWPTSTSPRPGSPSGRGAWPTRATPGARPAHPRALPRARQDRAAEGAGGTRSRAGSLREFADARASLTACTRHPVENDAIVSEAAAAIENAFTNLCLREEDYAGRARTPRRRSPSSASCPAAPCSSSPPRAPGPDPGAPGRLRRERGRPARGRAPGRSRRGAAAAAPAGGADAARRAPVRPRATRAGSPLPPRGSRTGRADPGAGGPSPGAGLGPPGRGPSGAG